MEKIFFYIILISGSLNAQFIDGSITNFLRHYPQATIKFSGIGNRGFDDSRNIYNPAFNKTDRVFTISAGGIYNITHRAYKAPDYNNNINSVGTVLPEFTVKFKKDNIQLAGSLYNDILFGVTPEYGTWSYRFRTDAGLREIMSEEQPEFTASNKVLQFSISGLINDNFSLSAGVITNEFIATSNWHAFTENYKTEFFNNLQVTGSVNYSINDVSAYFVLKSQSQREKLDKDAFYYREEIIPPFDPHLYMPGNIGYGLQYSVFSNLKISAEMSHQFFDIEEEKKDVYFTEKIRYHIWNNEYVFGINYQPFNNLQFGATFSKYMKYDNNVYYYYYSNESPFIVASVPPSEPWTVTAVLEYSLFNCSLSLHYQHTRLFYEYERYSIEDYGNFFKAVFTVSFL